MPTPLIGHQCQLLSSTNNASTYLWLSWCSTNQPRSLTHSHLHDAYYNTIIWLGPRLIKVFLRKNLPFTQCLTTLMLLPLPNAIEEYLTTIHEYYNVGIAFRLLNVWGLNICMRCMTTLTWQSWVGGMKTILTATQNLMAIWLLQYVGGYRRPIANYSWRIFLNVIIHEKLYVASIFQQFFVVVEHTHVMQDDLDMIKQGEWQENHPNIDTTQINGHSTSTICYAMGLRCVCLSCKQLLINLKIIDQNKHIKVCRHFIRGLVEAKEALLQYTSTS